MTSIYKGLPAKEQAAVDKFDYRILLKEEFEERRSRNAKYSLRSYAKNLGVSAAYLSQVFAHKRNLSEVTGGRLAKKMRWSVERKSLFVNLVRFQRAPDKDSKNAIALQMKNSVEELDFIDLKNEQHQLASKWVHFAILELVDVAGFKSDPKWIAKRLGVLQIEAEEAVRRLLKVGLMVEKNGRLEKNGAHYRITDVPSSAIRMLHRQHMQAAQKSLDTQFFTERDITGTTLAFQKEKINEVKELIRDFRGRLNKLCASHDRHDSVYQLSVQFFRLDKDLD